MIIPRRSMNHFLESYPENQTTVEQICTFGPQLYDIRNIPGKGRGLVAGIDISRGQRILHEQPLFTSSLRWTSHKDFEEYLASTIASLLPTKRDTFFALHNAHPESEHPLQARFITNCLTCQNGTEAAVYNTACMVNHSCRANAQWSWNKEAKAVAFHAVRNIAAGEEITINYIFGEICAVREDKLLRLFGIACSCELCSLSPMDIKKSDSRRNKIQKLLEEVNNNQNIMKKPERCLAKCGRLIALIDEEHAGHSEHLPVSVEAYDAAYRICTTHSDLASASVLQKRSYETRVIYEGSDNPFVKQIKNAMEYKHQETWVDGLRSLTKWHTTRDDEPKLLKFMGTNTRA
ncbi:MAG: hypothetical protein Q9210_001807 [Variospora velana]